MKEGKRRKLKRRGNEARILVVMIVAAVDSSCSSCNSSSNGGSKSNSGNKTEKILLKVGKQLVERGKMCKRKHE